MSPGCRAICFRRWGCRQSRSREPSAQEAARVSFDDHFDHHLPVFGAVRPRSPSSGVAPHLRGGIAADTHELSVDDWGQVKGAQVQILSARQRSAGQGSFSEKSGAAPDGFLGRCDHHESTLTRPGRPPRARASRELSGVRCPRTAPTRGWRLPRAAFTSGYISRTGSPPASGFATVASWQAGSRSPRSGAVDPMAVGQGPGRDAAGHVETPRKTCVPLDLGRVWS